MSNQADISISNPPPQENFASPETTQIEQLINNNFRFYNRLCHLSLAIAPLGFVLTMSLAIPDTFGLILLLLLETFFLIGAGFAIKAKRKVKLQLQKIATHSWILSVAMTVLFILYIWLVIGSGDLQFVWKVRGFTITTTAHTGKSLQILSLAYFLPLHLFVLGYLLSKGFAIERLLQERSQFVFMALKMRNDTMTMTMTMTQPNQQLDLSTVT